MRLRNRRWGLGAAVAASWALGGCGLLLGLDEYGPQTCTDGVKGEGETDVDCGGICAKVCGDGMGCGAPKDCESGVCGSLGLCEAASCTDGLKNGDESDKDCGGSCGATCKAGGLCEAGGDCVGGVCEGGACAATCTDKEKSGSETDVDCGGPDCDGCEIGQGCGVAGDCASGICHAEGCVAEHVWSMRFGNATQDQSGSSIAIDGADDIVVTGNFAGIINFGGAQLVSQKLGTIFAAKFSTEGNHLWSKRFETGLATAGPRVVTDAGQNIFLACGAFSGVDLGGGPLGDMDKIGAFIVKFDPSGNHLWSKGFTSQVGIVVFHDLTVDSSGAVILIGTFTNTVDFGDGAHTNQDNFEDVFIAKFHDNGTLAWSKSFASDLNVPPMRVGASSSGDILIGGSLRKNIDFGEEILTSNGSDDVLIVKLDSDGNYAWGNRYGDAAAQAVRAVLIDTTGNVIVAGRFVGTLDFGGNPLVGKGGQEVFVAKLNASGEHSWSHRFGDVGALGVDLLDAAVDASGNILIGGEFNSTIDFGAGPMTSAGGLDAFVLQLGDDGAHRWSRRFGDQETQQSPAIAVDNTGLLALTGGFQGSINFGGGELVSMGKKDVFIAKLAYP